MAVLSLAVQTRGGTTPALSTRLLAPLVQVDLSTQTRVRVKLTLRVGHDADKDDEVQVEVSGHTHTHAPWDPAALPAAPCARALASVCPALLAPPVRCAQVLRVVLVREHWAGAPGLTTEDDVQRSLARLARVPVLAGSGDAAAAPSTAASEPAGSAAIKQALRSATLLPRADPGAWRGRWSTFTVSATAIEENDLLTGVWAGWARGLPILLAPPAASACVPAHACMRVGARRGARGDVGVPDQRGRAGVARARRPAHRGGGRGPRGVHLAAGR